MPQTLDNRLVIAISSRALFDLEEENLLFEQQGEATYMKYQQDHENDILKPGSGFDLIKSFLSLNKLLPENRQTEVIIVSRNNADTGLRIFRSVEHYGLAITRAAFTSGAPVTDYLEAFRADLFLSAGEDDVRSALRHKIAAGLIYPSPISEPLPIDDLTRIRIAFDGDAVLFSEEAELIYKTAGLEAFIQHESDNSKKPLPAGPFARLLLTLSYLQNEIKDGHVVIRTALITARSSPSHERVIRTLREWNVKIDEIFFMGGLTKEHILKAFRPHIFFDDQDVHCIPASGVVHTAKVPNDAVEKKNNSLQSP